MRGDNSELAESIQLTNDYWEDLDKKKKERHFTQEANRRFQAKREAQSPVKISKQDTVTTHAGVNAASVNKIVK